MILKTLPIIGGILFICYIFQAFCKYYVSCQGHIMGAQMERDMRRKLFDHYENLSFSYYDQHNTGQMMSRLVSDLFDISEAAHHGPENLFISLVKIVGSFIFLFIIQWKLAIILLAIVLLMIFFSAKSKTVRCRLPSLITAGRLVMSMLLCKTPLLESVLCSLLQMKILNVRNFVLEMRHF